jgi:hypothetical protein
MPHANRSRRADALDRQPDWREVLAARQSAGLDQRQAARAVFVSVTAWARWEADPATNPDARKMPAANWWLFRLRTGAAALSDLPPVIDQP